MCHCTTIIIHSFFLSTNKLFASQPCILFCAQLRCSNTQLHTDWITMDCCPFCLVFRMFSKWKIRVLLLSKILSWKLVHVHFHTCQPRILNVGGLFGMCSMLMCICVSCTHCLLLRLLALCLLYLSLLRSWSFSCSSCLLFLMLNYIISFPFLWQYVTFRYIDI